MMDQELLYEVRDQVAWFTINREARRNAISQEMITGIREKLVAAETDPLIRALCFTGAGDKVFCSGADLGITLAGGGGDPMEGARNYADLLKKMARFPKPMVARVNGHCLAGGLGFMLSCDMAIAREEAYFSTPEVNVGIFPMMIGALIYRHIGRKKAMEMVLTGRRVPAPEAAQIGLITRFVPAEKLDEEVHQVLQGLTKKSPIGLSLGKRAFNEMADLPFEAAVDYLCQQLGEVIRTEDALEGMSAFLAKREPVFKGK
jgi:enoyl-CoA hydratase/carnithine racemase